MFAQRVEVGQPAVVEDDGDSGNTWRGHVMRISDWYTQRRMIAEEQLQLKDVRTLECLIALAAGRAGADRPARAGDDQQGPPGGQGRRGGQAGKKGPLNRSQRRPPRVSCRPVTPVISGCVDNRRVRDAIQLVESLSSPLSPPPDPAPPAGAADRGLKPLRIGASSAPWSPSRRTTGWWPSTARPRDDPGRAADHRPAGRRVGPGHRLPAAERQAVRAGQQQPALRHQPDQRGGHGGRHRHLRRAAERRGVRLRLRPCGGPHPRRQRRRAEHAGRPRHRRGGRLRPEHRRHPARRQPQPGRPGRRGGLHQRRRRGHRRDLYGIDSASNAFVQIGGFNGSPSATSAASRSLPPSGPTPPTRLASTLARATSASPP